MRSTMPVYPKGTVRGTDVPTMVQNVLRVYHTASERDKRFGKQWYATAYNVCDGLGHRFGIAPETIAHAIAALSPNVAWADNVADTKKLLRFMIDSEPLQAMRAYNANIAKAMAIIAEGAYEQLSGKKVTAFAANILGDYSQVCVDSHAIAIALGRERTTFKSNANTTDNQHRLIVDAYKRAAAIAGVEPAEMQAITWVTWRNKK